MTTDTPKYFAVSVIFIGQLFIDNLLINLFCKLFLCVQSTRASKSNRKKSRAKSIKENRESKRVSEERNDDVMPRKSVQGGDDFKSLFLPSEQAISLQDTFIYTPVQV